MKLLVQEAIRNAVSAPGVTPPLSPTPPPYRNSDPWNTAKTAAGETARTTRSEKIASTPARVSATRSMA